MAVAGSQTSRTWLHKLKQSYNRRRSQKSSSGPTCSAGQKAALRETILQDLGCAIEGDTKGGKPHGRGKMRYPSGDEYDGGWMDSHQYGEGTYTRPDGYSYIGNWNMGKREGQGVAQWPSGSKYTGEFLNGFIHGEGTWQVADGTIYTGSIHKEKAEGLGELRWVNGGIYKGSFRNGLRDGYGVYTWPTGSNIAKYIGEWREGAPCGSDGVCTRSDGSLCLPNVLSTLGLHNTDSPCEWGRTAV